MIKDKLIKAETYYSISENLRKGLEWLKNSNLKSLQDGKYEIDGDNIYASVQTYETKEDAYYESHQKYIDIQYMISGLEQIGVTDIANCSTAIPYDESRDLEFYNINTKEEYIELAEGQFLILYPHDAHKPSIKKDGISTVKKVVVKVRI